MPFTFAYAYWTDARSLAGARGAAEPGLTVGAAETLLDRLPAHTPGYVHEQLDALQALDTDPAVIDMLIDAVIGILENIADFDNYDGKINIATDVEGLFENGAVISEDDILIYASSNPDGTSDLMIVHINPDSNFSVNSPDDLYYALERPWTGVNQISGLWLRGNLYTTYNSPLEYKGKYYLMYYNGPSGIPPPEDRNTWFELGKDDSFNPANKTYLENHIVFFDGEYFIAAAGTWGQTPSTGSWAWTHFEAWQESGLYNRNAVVKTATQDGIRFWRSIADGNTAAPGEGSARSGLWREINNGWIGRDNETTVKCHYFYHNTYDTGDTVIYGVTPKLKYRYFTAKTAVPADAPPLINEDGAWVLNADYWENY